MHQKTVKFWLLFAAGFLLLCCIYHLPDFFHDLRINAVALISFLTIAFCIGVFQGKNGLAGFGLSMTNNWFRLLSRGLAVGFLFFALSTAISIRLGLEGIEDFASGKEFLRQMPVILLFTAIPSLAENILTRGYLWGHLEGRINASKGITISTLVFVLNNIWQFAGGPAAIIRLLVLGFILAFVVWKTRSLWMAFGLQWGGSIAFEMTNSLVKTETAAGSGPSNWVLSFSLLLMGAFLIFGRHMPVQNPLPDAK